MTTLLLRLAGPMQSWGTQSRFSDRDTDLDPSFSGVVGLLGAALGRRRDEPVDDLVALQMGVRVDREGTRAVDYHTAGGTHDRGRRYGVYKANRGTPETVVSFRHYLADADFLVALEGVRLLLERIDQALARPVWPLSLGRRSFPPSLPVRIIGSLSEVSIATALRTYPWITRVPGERPPEQLRLLLPGTPADADQIRMDVPVSFAEGRREFAPRRIQTAWTPVPEVT